MRVEEMRAFIIKLMFLCIIVGLVYLCFKFILPMLMPFLVGFLFAFLLKPAINWITQHTRLPRKPVAVILLIIFYLILGSLLTVLGTRIVYALQDAFKQIPNIYSGLLEPAILRIQTFLKENLKTLNPSLTQSVESLGDSLMSSLSSSLGTVSSSAIGWITGLATSLPSFLLKFLITIVSSFFFVADYYHITSFLAKQMPEKWREALFSTKTQGVDVVFKFAKAYGILMCITFAELFVGFLLLRIDNALLIAVFTAIVDILPIVGTGTILIPWAAATLILGNVPLGIGLLVLYLIITVVRQILEPRIVGRQLGLYPLVTLLCMFVGSYLFGVVGLFGLPILATVLLQMHRSGQLHLFRDEEAAAAAGPGETVKGDAAAAQAEADQPFPEK